jgi:hypothetical protein
VDRRWGWSQLLVPAALGVALAVPVAAHADPWALKYSEDFSKPMNTDSSAWSRYNYDNPFDTIMDDDGDWWKNDYGPNWESTVLNSFGTYRKNVRFGSDGWLTATLSARDKDLDGTPESPPTMATANLPDQGNVLKINSPDSYDGAFLTTSEALPQHYRLEYHLKTLNFGGERNGSINYDGKVNGYTIVPGECKTQFPYAEGIGTAGWTSKITANPCDWQSVTDGPYGYNAFHLIGIVDFAHPQPANLHFWHYRRKILMDSFAQHPDRVGTGSGGRVCNPLTNTFYNYRDSTKNVVDMWINGLPNFAPGKGGITGNGQYFMTTCTNGTASNQASPSAAAEFRPDVMPNEDYTFAVERDTTGYTEEVTGNFGHGVGVRTFRFHRNFVVGNVPIWHYNTSTADGYTGQYNNTLRQNGVNGAEQWPNQWAAGSVYPDYPVIGDPYTDAGEGDATISGVKLFVLDETAPAITIGSPLEGATFTQGRPVPVSYSCADPTSEGAPGTGVTDCVGDVASGGNLDTSTPGAHTFTVTTHDGAGNQGSLTRHYTVLTATNVDGSVGGAVPATLALTLGTPAAFGAFTPGVAKAYEATMGATVVSTAGGGQLSVADPSTTATGHLVNGAFSLPSPLLAKAGSPTGTGGALASVGGSSAPTSLLTYTGPVSNDAVSLTFHQDVGATDALRTGSYAKTLTFTLSTTTP